MVGYTALMSLTRPRTALSSEANGLRSNAGEVAGHVERSMALFGDKAEALNSLLVLAAECAEDDWDGYGSHHVNPAALYKTTAFIRALPDGIDMPEFSVEPDGSISLDWMPSRTQTFSVSIGETDRIPYAWMDGTDRGHAVAKSFASEVPARIVRALAEMLPNAASVRAA